MGGLVVSGEIRGVGKEFQRRSLSREASAYRVFRPTAEGSTEGTSRGCRRPRGMSPRLIPTHEVRKNPISTSTDESIGITFAVWAIIPQGGHCYTKTPHGMFYLYGK